MPGVSVCDLEIDLDKYRYGDFSYHTADFQVLSEYVNIRTYDVMVRRLDQEEGWTDELYVFAHFSQTTNNQRIRIGTSSHNEKTVRIETAFDIYPSNKCSEQCTKRLPTYTLLPKVEGNKLTREIFNQEFQTDLVILPSNIYAVGVKDGKMYMYNERYENYYCIIHQIKHIVQIAMTYDYPPFYFLIESGDGYMQDHYLEVRTIPRQIQETECLDKRTVSLDLLDHSQEYPIFHHRKYILTQSSHKHTPYLLDIPDKHYFYHNLYHSFRSFHQGIPFSHKINKVVYAGQNRGGNKNFIKRRDIQITQREYFRSDAVSKENVICGGWIDRTDMIYYKYILDIDGEAATWDATAWKLNSGSLIFKTQSAWKQWFHSMYIKGVHFIEIEEDFSDLQEKFAWCESHQEECLQMIQNSKALFQKVYAFPFVMEHTKRVLDILTTPELVNNKIHL
jgi:hypothetical protein